MDSGAILFSAVHTVTVATVDIPQPGPGEVLLRAAYTCISPGTELRCLAGRQPDAAPYPYIPGYALAGTVLAAGAGAHLEPGQRVFGGGTTRASVGRMWGGHVQYAVQPAADVLPVPPALDLRHAALARLAGIAYHGLRLAAPAPHETVVVVGLGVLGQLAARLYALAGARVLALDTQPARVALAQQAGLTALTVTAGRTLAETARDVLPAGADVLVDVTGAAAVLPQALPLLREVPWDDALERRPRYVVQGSYPDAFSIPYQPAFLKEITFLLPRDRQPRDVAAVLDFMARGQLPVADLISRTAPPAAAATTYAALQAGELLTAVFDWQAFPG